MKTPDRLGHTLVICEKPDAAWRVASALAEGDLRTTAVEGVKAFRFRREGQEFVVCSAQGHLFSISDPFRERTVYPVFDLEWYPSDRVHEMDSGIARRIIAIRRLSVGASKFVNACDYDAEGETIGHNILRYACGMKQGEAVRAKFSTLTKEDIEAAFRNAEPQIDRAAAAGRTRHLADFAWGVNLSRSLSHAALVAGASRRTISMGRVQGPALAFLIEKEAAIRAFVPLPYWKVSGTFGKGGILFRAGYSNEKLGSRSAAEKAKHECEGGEAVVSNVARSSLLVPPPPPFSTGDLQHEAYRVFKLSPSQTLQVAEKLYLRALISYPRTASQSLPPMLNFRAILSGLGRIPRYTKDVATVFHGALRPARGSKVDPAHPAIHPTGEVPRGSLGRIESELYDLIVRRFLAGFGPSANREVLSARLAVGGYEFALTGEKTTFRGWTEVYGDYAGHRDRPAPDLGRGDTFSVKRVEIEEKFESAPLRYNQGTLLERMELENIGTKATRAEIISTLHERGYVKGNSIVVTDLGFAVAEAMRTFAPTILGTKLTRDIETGIEGVENGKDEGELVRETVRSIAEQIMKLYENEEMVGMRLGAALAGETAASSALGPCPKCRSGQLRIVRSRRTKKRFVGCSNYPRECRASAPLPQRGVVKGTNQTCPHCAWPIVEIMGGKWPWRFCVNLECFGKRSKR